MAARAGIEPATNGLTVRHSTTELPGREVERGTGYDPATLSLENLCSTKLSYPRNLKEHGDPELVQRRPPRFGCAPHLHGILYTRRPRSN